MIIKKFFLVNGDNYTKFIRDNLEDVFLLPVTRKMNDAISNTSIELSVLSGNAEFYLYESLDFTKEITNIILAANSSKQSYYLTQENLTELNLYNRELYAVVREKNNNTLYNILYLNEIRWDSSGKQLEDFRMSIETLTASNKKNLFIYG